MDYSEIRGFTDLTSKLNTVSGGIAKDEITAQIRIGDERLDFGGNAAEVVEMVFRVLAAANLGTARDFGRTLAVVEIRDLRVSFGDTVRWKLVGIENPRDLRVSFSVAFF